MVYNQDSINLLANFIKKKAPLFLTGIFLSLYVPKLY